MPEPSVDYAKQIPSFVIPEGKIITLGGEPEKAAPAPEPAKEAQPESAPETQTEVKTEPVKEEVKAEEKATTDKEPEKNVTRRFERRIDRAIRAKAEAQARAELLEKELTELKSKQTQPTPTGAPKPEDFTDVEDYAKAREKWAVDNVLKERETKEREAQRTQELTQISSEWEEHVEKGVDKYDDFQEVVGDLKPTSEWAIAIMQQDNAEEVAYYLGTHEKEAQKIISLHPRKQHQEIARISAKLSLQTEAPKKPSKAPEPIKPVQGAAETTEVDPFKPQSYEQYVNSLKKAQVPFGKH